MYLYELVQPALSALGVAPEALQVQHAETLVSLYHPCINPDQPALIGPVTSAGQCRALCQRLAQVYPGAHRVVVLSQAGTPQAEAVDTSLIDAPERLGTTGPHLVYVPPLPCAGSVVRFQDTVAHLRAQDGCPWDREQTHRSLRQGFQEEAYEVLDALDRDDLGALQEELGDMLLHILLQVQIATEQGEFRLSDVVCHVNKKIVYRHPHVFAGLQVEDVAEVLVNWEALKLQEKESAAETPAPLAGISVAMPALARAQSIQRHVDGSEMLENSVPALAARVASDLKRLGMAKEGVARTEALGDLLFELANLARKLGVDAESALREANLRFEEQFRAQEGDRRNEATGQKAGSEGSTPAKS